MNELITITITEEMQSKRIDIALAELSKYSRSMIQKLIYEKKITTNNISVIKPNKTVLLDEVYIITPPEPTITHIIPQKGELEILFEDEHLIVINKQAELVTHPGIANYTNTLVNFLAYHCSLSDVNGVEKLGVVHRLDKGVSGCIIFAKTNESHINLSQQFQNRTITKIYTAICYGKIQPESGQMEDFIGRSEFNRQKMASKESGKHSVMDYKTLDCKYLDKHFGFISKILCMPKTGRMHQIRVQLSTRKIPIIGDKTYGKKEHKELFKILKTRIALHANKLVFQHPITNQTLTVEAPEPKEFKEIMNYQQIAD